MIVKSFSRIGLYHEMRGIQNQDCVSEIDAPWGSAILLADGATGCKQGGEGARIACEAVKQIIREEGSRFFTYPAEKMAYLLEEQILYCIEKTGAEEKMLREYGSTLAFVLLEKGTGRCICLNLGDSAVFSMNKDRIHMILEPQKIGGGPCLTTSRNAWKSMRICETELPDDENICIASDGFLDAMQDERIFSSVMQENMSDVEAALKMKEPMDDCSFIEVKKKAA